MIRVPTLARVCTALGAVLWACACSLPERAPARTAGAWGFEQIGAMMPVMREGHTEARASLSQRVQPPHAIAVGAIEGLDGEITAVDGEVWVSRVRDGGVVTSGPGVVGTDRATLLTAARVERWRTVTLKAGSAGPDLEAIIERSAADHGIDTSRPFPFVIQGEATLLDMHVINGFCRHSGGEAAPDRAPWRLTRTEPTPATIVGFFASHAGGIVTHHGTSLHAHALVTVDERRVTGHVDSLAMGAGALLRLPDSP